jgi:hypothetical protein
MFKAEVNSSNTSNDLIQVSFGLVRSQKLSYS